MSSTSTFPTSALPTSNPTMQDLVHEKQANMQRSIILPYNNTWYYCTRLLLCQSMRSELCWTHADTVREATAWRTLKRELLWVTLMQTSSGGESLGQTSAKRVALWEGLTRTQSVSSS